jgi:hypothetical protein
MVTMSLQCVNKISPVSNLESGYTIPILIFQYADKSINDRSQLIFFQMASLVQNDVPIGGEEPVRSDITWLMQSTRREVFVL